MSRMISLRLNPSKYICQELLKEFSVNRFFLNHYEFVDFTIFEYGQRAQYLQWRVFSVLLIFLLSAHVFFPTVGEYANATPCSRLIYMHSWLAVLTFLHSLLEVINLIWIYFTIPSPVLVRIHQTPWHFKILWLMYNGLYPNIMSCNVMYYMVLKNMEESLGESKLFLALMASFTGIHVSVTAIPSRLPHIIHPLLFNVFHIVVTIIYQMCSFTDPHGHYYVYAEMDWVNSRPTAIIVAVIWLLTTCCCHLLMVWCCWVRRLVYRCKRNRGAMPIYGFSPEEYYPFNDDTATMDHFEIPLDDRDATNDALIEAAPQNKKVVYSPHLSYRQVVDPPLKNIVDSDGDPTSSASQMSKLEISSNENLYDKYSKFGRILVGNKTQVYPGNVSYHGKIQMKSPSVVCKRKRLPLRGKVLRNKQGVGKKTNKQAKSRKLKSLKRQKVKSTKNRSCQLHDFPVRSTKDECSDISSQVSSRVAGQKSLLNLYSKVRREPSPESSLIVHLSDEENDSLTDINMIHWKSISTEVQLVENTHGSVFITDLNVTT